MEKSKCKIYPEVYCNQCGKCVFYVNKEFFHVYGKKENPESDVYGLAFDLGSTNLCGRLYNLSTGELTAGCSLENPQRLFGKDVITRQSYVLNHEEGQTTMHRLLIDGINRSAEFLLNYCNISSRQIERITAGGNTTISHFLLDLPVRGLAEIPFKPAFSDSVTISGGCLGLILDVPVYIPGNLGGHVGSDITAGLLNDTLLNSDELTIYVDIGTNGEITLKEKDSYLVTSVAAGPVFEEGYLELGMNAVEGAITRVSIGRTVSVNTIGDKDPEGLCGSGIVSAISEMIKAGIVNREGRLSAYDEMKRRYASKDILERIDEENRRFYLTEKVYISGEDIRKFLLAKAALRAGITTLLKKRGKDESSIGKLVLTGAMGSHVTTEDLIRTGIIPEPDKNKIEYLENGALEGLSLLLLEKCSHEKVEQIRASAENVFLNETDEFEKEYIGEMVFK